MNKIKFSVIIPVYNGEKYINRSINSIINQTCKDWELIIVNDGSKDNTEIIVQDLINKNLDKKIKYIKIENSGPSTARNIGFDASEGEYVCFLDSDDEYDHTLFAKLMLLDPNYDVCFFGWKEISEHSHVKYYNDSFKYVENEKGIDVVFKKFNREVWLCNCNEIYKRELLINNNIRYPEGLFMGEDACFIYTALINAKNVTSLKENLFINHIRQNSLMRSKISERDLTELDAINELIRNIEISNNITHEEKDNLTDMFQAYYDYVKLIITKKIADEFSLLSYYKFKEKQKRLLNDCNVNVKKIKKYLKKDFYRQALAYKLSPFLFFIVYKVSKRR